MPLHAGCNGKAGAGVVFGVAVCGMAGGYGDEVGLEWHGCAFQGLMAAIAPTAMHRAKQMDQMAKRCTGVKKPLQ